jgi:divalent metal cation (Fe/Co/Zn/Cd) transporter
MKKQNLGLLFTGLLLLGAGLLSPSNGVDDKVDRQPLDMLAETVLIICSAVVIYWVIRQVSKIRQAQ